MRGDEDVGRRLRELAVPNVLANLSVPLAGWVDTAVLGHLDDPAELAGVALATIVFDLVLWSFGFLRMGTTGLVAQAIGRADPGEAVRIGARAIGLGLVAGLLIFAARAAIGDAAFAVLEGAPDVELAARSYYDARILAAPAALVGFACTGSLLGQGLGRAVLMVVGLGSAVNIALDVLFVSMWGWGAWGAGVATAASQATSAAVGLTWVLVKGWAHRDAVAGGLRDTRSWMDVVALNRDILIRTLSLVAVFALFTDFSAVLGAVTLAANAVLLRVVSAAAWIIDGIAFATEALAGRWSGAGARDRLVTLLKLGCRDACLLGTTAALVTWLWPAAVLGILTDQAPVLTQAGAHAAWLFPVLGVGSFAYIFDGYFLGRSAGPTLRRAMLASALIGFVPWALVARSMGSSHGLWAALATFMLARVITLGAAVPGTLREAA